MISQSLDAVLVSASRAAAAVPAAAAALLPCLMVLPQGADRQTRCTCNTKRYDPSTHFETPFRPEARRSGPSALYCLCIGHRAYIQALIYSRLTASAHRQIDQGGQCDPGSHGAHAKVHSAQHQAAQLIDDQ